MKKFLLFFGFKTLLAAIFIMAFFYTGWPDGMFCREISTLFCGDLDRQELLDLYETIEPGMSELQLLDTYRENSPLYLDIMPTRDGFRVFERTLFPGLHWRLMINCEDNMVISVRITYSSDDLHPTNAPTDKFLSR
ncbi:MAG: hypothetical protein GX117_13415 [Candidatus Hydrogenedentes bacterium]|jgi:hypothetical protein|nr:hypothetical protein [Candidatus Hydrogenedentota bacterium]